MPELDTKGILETDLELERSEQINYLHLNKANASVQNLPERI
jgi:hypothetical protein